MKTIALVSMLLTIGFVVGCDVPEMDLPEQPAGVATAEAKVEKQESTVFGKEDWYLPDGRVDMSGVEGEPPMTTGTPRPITPKDPKKGKLTRRRGGKMLGTSLQALPWATNETIFKIVIKSALAQYDAINGQPPRSHKEFMEKFMPEFCPQVTLPELEPGDAYLYDPEDSQLKIFRPSEPGAPQVEGVVAYEKKAEESDE